MKLDYNKVITQKLDIYDEDEYKKLKEKKKSKEKRTIGRSEWVYYLWYLNLKLCLEMEEKGIHLQRRRKYKSGVQVQRKVSHIHRLKINRKFYEGIDWEDLKTLTWSVWKKKYLEVFMSGDIRKIQHGDDWKCEPQYLYLEMDLRNTEIVLVNQLKKILKGENRKNLPSSMGIQGSPNYHPLILGYNMTVGRIEGEDWIKVCNRMENLGRMEELLKKKETTVKSEWFSEEDTYKDFTDKGKELNVFLRELNKGDLSELDEFEGFCYSNLHRYIINTQKVLYNVSQGRFFDKTDIPKNKWKDKWSQKTFIW